MKILRNGQAEPLDRATFKKVCDSFSNAAHRMIFSLCWYTTDRPGAILQLQVNQVYRDAARSLPLETIVIPARSRKDKRTREVAVSKALAWELKRFKPPLDGWLFPGGNYGEHLTFGAYQKALYVKFDELGMKGYSTYSTRRGSLTTLAKQGVGLRQIQAVSGHQSLASLQRYLQVDAAECAQVLALL